MTPRDKIGPVAVIGASSLRGKEVKQLIDDRGFPASDLRLIDDDAIGTLTEARGEATFIQPLEEDGFEGVRFAFFAGDAGFTARNWPQAHRAGATVIDLSGVLAEVPTAVPWIPSLDSLLPAPQPPVGKLFASPGVNTIVGCTVAAALHAFPVTRLAIIFFQPVSESGQAGIDELESQTVKLLSFQSVSQEVYDTQVAFNLLTRYGDASRERLGDVRAAVARGIARYVAGRAPVPAVQLVQAPVFYSSAFTAFVELTSAPPMEELHAALARAGIRISADDAPPLGNINVAGENHIFLARIERDTNLANAYWLWGAADNVRVAAVNAISIAEKLLAA